MTDDPEEHTEQETTGRVSKVKRYLGIVRQYMQSHPRTGQALRIIAIVTVALIALALPLYLAPALQHSWGSNSSDCRVDSALLNDRVIRRKLAGTRSEITMLERRLASYIPTQNYLVINTVDNRFFLYRHRSLVREGFCSSGSYTLLRTEDGEKEWIFKTPRGRFTIQGKITHPVWRKPDWAFIEEGLPIPGQVDPSRYEYGVLGDYAMSLGDGYLIHGTLYKRQLGMPVTHGCIRLNDDDLEAVFRALSVGSKVYIY